MPIDRDFVTSIRTSTSALPSYRITDDELKASLEHGGWNPLLPAIKDERGVLLVGNRRTKFARELGIEPVVVAHTFGTGVEADAARARLAWVSNVGGDAVTPADRKRVAARLYGENMTQATIAAILGVSQNTISLDLEGVLSTVDNTPRTSSLGHPRGGRPRGRPPGSRNRPRDQRAPPAGNGAAHATPAPAAAAPASAHSGQAELAQGIVRPLIEAGQEVSPTRLAQLHGIPRVHFRAAISIESARWAASQTATPAVDPASLPRSAQDRLAAAMRQQERRLNAEHAVRMNEVAEEVRRRVVDGNREYLARLHAREQEAEQQLATYREFTNRHRPLLSLDEFNLLRKCLHQNGIAANPQDFDAAFNLIQTKKFQLTGQR